jgi:hypothetical protein
MNIYISHPNEEWLRIQKKSMSGIVNGLLDEARAGKHGLHVLASYDTLEEAQRSDVVHPNKEPDHEEGYKAYSGNYPPVEELPEPKVVPNVIPDLSSVIKPTPSVKAPKRPSKPKYKFPPSAASQL